MRSIRCPNIWLIDGTALASGRAVGPNPGTAWQVEASGDFNGDGKADIYCDRELRTCLS